MEIVMRVIFMEICVANIKNNCTVETIHANIKNNYTVDTIHASETGRWLIETVTCGRCHGRNLLKSLC